MESDAFSCEVVRLANKVFSPSKDGSHQASSLESSKAMAIHDTLEEVALISIKVDLD